MSGSDNTKRGQPFTKENAAEMGRRGGKASGEAKRRKKTEKERYEILMDMALSKGSVKDIEKVKNFASLSKYNLTVADMIAAQMLQRAMSGDREAARMIYSIIGQMAPQVESSGFEADDDGFLEALNASAAEDWGGADET